MGKETVYYYKYPRKWVAISKCKKKNASAICKVICPQYVKWDKFPKTEKVLKWVI
jgi:hypothetical protein